jgi:tyrosine-protein kinase
LLGIGLAALLEALDSRLRTSESIVDRLGLPLLARIPEPPRKLDRNQLVMIEDPNGPEAEAIRILMTNLELAHLEQPAHSVMFTSAVEKEGKSTTVANLAVALARAGRRVVLVDLDFRNPSLHRFFGLASTPGLTDVVLGRNALKDVINRVDIGSPRSLESLAPMSNGGPTARWASVARREATPMWAGAEPSHLKEGQLEVLSAGTAAANPGELVAQLPIAPILEFLKGKSDFVLVDGPPLLQVGDAITLSSAVDALIVVSRINVVRAPMLDDLNRVLRACPAKKLGLVVAGAELETGYGYLGYPRHRLKAVV